MNQNNGKNSLGLDRCFEDLDNPIDLFKNWFSEAEKSEINDPNAFSLGTATSDGRPSVRMVLLKGLSNDGFVFYSNFNSRKGNDLKKNPKASMCFYWESLKRQVCITGEVNVINSKEADEYYNSRPYESRIGAWASSQSDVMKHRDEFIKKIKEFKIKYPDKNKVPRPSYWSGWRLKPEQIEFWLKIENRAHQRLNYRKDNGKWNKEILYP